MPLFKDLLASAGGSTMAFTKDSPVGAGVEGPIIGVTVRPATDPVTQKVKLWDDGSPAENVVITVQTAQRRPDIDDDDGSRSIWVKWWGVQRIALVQALREAKADDLEVGGHFSAQFTGYGPQPDNKAISPAKLFTYTYRAPSGAAALLNAKEPVTNGFTAPLEQPLPPRLPSSSELPYTPPTAANAGTMGQAAPATTAPPAPADFVALAEQVRKLAAMGVPVVTITTMTGLDAATVSAVMLAPVS